MSNSNLSNAHTISITVKGLTVFMTEYEVSDCSSSTTANNQAKRNAVSTSSVSDNLNTNGHSENDSDHNDGTLDDIPSKIEDTDGSVQLNSDDDDDEDYLKKSGSKKNATSSSR